MFRYKLRTLLILLAVGPPMLGAIVMYVRVDSEWRSCVPERDPPAWTDIPLDSRHVSFLNP